MQVTLSRRPTTSSVGRRICCATRSQAEISGAILDRALTLLVADLEKTRLAATARPRALRKPTRQSRHVPAAVKQRVWAGTRDNVRSLGAGALHRARALEIRHVVPVRRRWSAGCRESGDCWCRRHNAYEAAQFFGPLPTAGRRSRTTRSRPRRCRRTGRHRISTVLALRPAMAGPRGKAARGYHWDVSGRLGLDRLGQELRRSAHSVKRMATAQGRPTAHSSSRREKLTAMVKAAAVGTSLPTACAMYCLLADTASAAA